MAPTDKQPPATPSYLLSYPAPFTLLITINRTKAMNSLPYASHWEAAALLEWFDNEPQLRVAIVTGSGEKAFCAGQDLIEQGKLRMAEMSGSSLPPRSSLMHPPSGFMGISRRAGKKPIIAAVNGFALGGGFEIVLGCDIIVASPTATFGLPEASRGLYAGAGGLSRLVRVVGIHTASEIAMAGRVLSAAEAKQLGIVSVIADAPGSAACVAAAVKMAARIGELSPDAIIVTRAGLREALETASVERASQLTDMKYGIALRDGENIRIGLRAFAEKKKPQWVPSKI